MPNPAKAKELVTLTRDRIEEVLGEAVERGHVTVDGAHGIVTALVRKGLQKGRRPHARRSRPAFPIEGYDDLTAAQVKARLADLSPAQLRKVRDYERTHANRKTVLGAVDKRLG